MGQYALITGARQGLGKGFAIELTKMNSGINQQVFLANCNQKG